MNKDLENKTVYLTFDDGPSTNTGKILDILAEHDIKATFFVCGSNTEEGKKLYKRIVDEGHAIGNHTYSHNYKYIYSSEENFLEDFYRLEELIYSVTGVRPEIMRFPGGSNNTVSRRYSDDAFMERITTKILFEGYQYFDWNVDSLDASKVTQSKDVIVKAVLNGVLNNDISIVLFHDSWPKTTTVEALPIILKELLDRGYTFEPLTKDSYYKHFL